MRLQSLLTAMAACCLPAIAHADSHSFTLSTGYNETALTGEFNRGTVLQSEINRGSMLYAGSVDSRGLASFGLGRIVTGQDPYYHTSLYPMVTAFARAGEGSGIALDLNQDWYILSDPSSTPGRYLTLFQTRAGIVWQDGEQAKVRVTQRFVSTERKQPGRSQGIEWILEFRQDYPADFMRYGSRGALTPINRRSMRQEQWAFFTRELGFGIARLSVGATYKTVFREVEGGQVTALRRNSTQSQVPVLMARFAYQFKRW